MSAVNMHDAKTQFSRLVDRAAAGETIIIAKAGTPVARLVPLEPVMQGGPRRTGFLLGMYSVPDDFDRMFEEDITNAFEGDE
jgi:prevent-host-death family protein